MHASRMVLRCKLHISYSVTRGIKERGGRGEQRPSQVCSYSAGRPGWHVLIPTFLQLQAALSECDGMSFATLSPGQQVELNGNDHAMTESRYRYG